MVVVEQTLGGSRLACRYCAFPYPENFRLLVASSQDDSGGEVPKRRTETTTDDVEPTYLRPDFLLNNAVVGALLDDLASRYREKPEAVASEF